VQLPFPAQVIALALVGQPGQAALSARTFEPLRGRTSTGHDG